MLIHDDLCRSIAVKPTPENLKGEGRLGQRPSGERAVKHAVPEEHRAFAKRQRREMSRAECMIWEVLRASRLGGWKFKRQVPYGPYVADFSCAEAKLIVELDGPLHEDAEQQARDAARDRWFEGRGFRVLRVPNGLVLGSIE